MYAKFAFIDLVILLVVGSAPAYAVDWQNGNWARQCDFYGNDLSHVVIDSSLCGGKCAETRGCTHFSWSKYNGGTCWMKTGGATKNDAVSTNDGTMVCGVMEHNTIDWQNGNWARQCDFDGNDLSDVVIDSSLCGGKCAQTPGCTHFSWSKYNGGTCWMKTGGATKNDAFSTNDATMVCGVMDGTPPGTGQPGVATRYWDCCKPSCSWPGKVPGNKNVRSCHKDGYGTAGSNEASGCGGGSAFACNNHQPWAVNDQLAYGFAAATIPGLGESQRCCACYRLEFTSGPVQGKTMIVQVTNSGGDVNPNQFDLQIPGGGVGLFNGCSPQWGAGPDGWGNKYGGVSSRDQCNWLPDQIRQGCFWRFDWFRGADNPTMTYSKVRCPDELVAASGCRRDDE